MNSAVKTKTVRVAALVTIVVAVAAATVAGAPAAQATTVTTDDTSSSITYSGDWAIATGSSGYFDGTAHYSADTATPAKATISFTGTSISLIAGTNSSGGRSNAQICDSTGANCSGTTLVDFYSATPAAQQTVYSAAGLGSGAHELVLTLRADTSGTNHYSDVDAYELNAVISGTHYVDNMAPGCLDAGDGTTTTAPWCDFAPLEHQALAAGAEVLLKSGDTFTQPLVLTGSGTSSSWITLGSYGSGSLPIVQGTGQGSDRTVVLQNPDYWHVQDLELTNAGEGLLAEYTTPNHAGLDIEGIYAHDLSGIFNNLTVGTPPDYQDLQMSAGITISGAGVPVLASGMQPTGQTVLNGLTIRNDSVHNAAGVWVLDDPNKNGQPVGSDSTFTSVSITHNTFSGSPGPIIDLESTQSPVVESNGLDCSGGKAEGQGTTCFFVADVDSALIQNNTIMNMPDTGSSDQTGIDFEYKVSKAEVRGNYFGHNAGAAIEFLQFGRTGDYNDQNVVEENDFYDNGTSAKGQPGEIVLATDQLGPMTPVDPQVTIAHNDYEAASSGFITGGARTNVTSSDNTLITYEHPTALQFASTQGPGGWHEQSYNGSGTWADMSTYNPSPPAWTGTSGSSIDPFVLTPGASPNQWVAREWVAPLAGSVTIRGQVFKDTTGGNVSVLIEQNGVEVWPTSGGSTYDTISDTSGESMNLTLTVAANDDIRFVVYGSGSSSVESTSWTPSVDYQ